MRGSPTMVSNGVPSIVALLPPPVVEPMRLCIQLFSRTLFDE
jgi:hypothetical protein